MPRPRKLTIGLRERIAQAVSHGSSYRAAAQAAGIGESTLHSWLARGHRMVLSPTLPRRVTHTEEVELLDHQAALKAAEEEVDRRRGARDRLVLELVESKCRAADIAEILEMDRSAVYVMLDRARGR
jgi:transposase-like protein